MKKLKQAKEICPTTTLGRVKDGALIVDVRSISEAAEVNFEVPKYMNIPLDELEVRINEIPKNEEIIMVCRSGDRSLKATYYLMNAGYKDVSNMKNGIIKWAAKGFPTIGDTNEILNDNCDCFKPNCC